jgi:hypothetical protein
MNVAYTNAHTATRKSKNHPRKRSFLPSLGPPHTVTAAPLPRQRKTAYGGMGCAHREKSKITAPAAYRRQATAFSRSLLQPPFLRRIHRLLHIFSASGAKTPAPARKKSQGQNCFVPLRSSPQFSQLIHTALFCAALIRNIKGRPQCRDRKARLRLIKDFFPKNKPVFSDPQSPAHKSLLSKTAQKTPAPRSRHTVTFSRNRLAPWELIVVCPPRAAQPSR